MGTWVGAIRTRLADAGEVRHAASLGGDVAEISSPAELGGEIRRGHRAAVSGEIQPLPFHGKRMKLRCVPDALPRLLPRQEQRKVNENLLRGRIGEAHRAVQWALLDSEHAGQCDREADRSGDEHKAERRRKIAVSARKFPQHHHACGIAGAADDDGACRSPAERVPRWFAQRLRGTAPA